MHDFTVSDAFHDALCAVVPALPHNSILTWQVNTRTGTIESSVTTPLTSGHERLSLQAEIADLELHEKFKAYVAICPYLQHIKGRNVLNLERAFSFKKKIDPKSVKTIFFIDTPISSLSKNGEHVISAVSTDPAQPELKLALRIMSAPCDALHYWRSRQGYNTNEFFAPEDVAIAALVERLHTDAQNFLRDPRAERDNQDPLQLERVTNHYNIRSFLPDAFLA